jgi:hypothetical protein
VASPSGRPDDPDDVKDNVLGVDAFGKLATHANAHVLSLALKDCLSREDVLDLYESQGSARTVWEIYEKLAPHF